MMARTHMVAGGAAWMLFSTAITREVNPALMLVSAWAALLPDIDHPGSVVGRKVLPISLLISGIFGHRGITHSLIATLLMTVGALHFLQAGSSAGIIVAAISVGYLSHLFTDWLTPSGIPLLWPSKRRFGSPFSIRTGGVGEFFLMVGMVAGIAFFLRNSWA